MHGLLSSMGGALCKRCPPSPHTRTLVLAKSPQTPASAPSLRRLALERSQSPWQHAAAQLLVPAQLAPSLLPRAQPGLQPRQWLVLRTAGPSSWNRPQLLEGERVWDSVGIRGFSQRAAALRCPVLAWLCLALLSGRLAGLGWRWQSPRLPGLLLDPARCPCLLGRLGLGGSNTVCAGTW